MSLKGITEGLRVLNQPIDALARLPQEQIIAMSQQPAGSPNRIPPDYVATILKAKADMAQAAANMKALQQPSQPSIVEQSMAINAQAEAPQQELMDSGVASLPVPEEMYSGDGYAGGGIVAFQSGGETEGLGDTFFGTEQAQYEYPDNRTRAEKERDYAYEIFAKDQEKAQQKMRDVFSGRVPLDRNLATQRIGAEATRALKSQDAARSAAAAAAAPPPPRPREEPQAKPPASGIASIQKPATKEDQFTRRKRMLDELGVTDTTDEELLEVEKNKSKLSDDKFDALRMSIIRAGLGIAAGTSPYALTNVAKGGIEGFDTYEQSIKQIKAEEKEYGKLARDLRKESNALKRSDVDKALALEHQAELMDIERDKLRSIRSSADKPSDFQQKLTALTGGSKDPEIIKQATRTILGVSKTGELTLEEALRTVSNLTKNVNATPAQLLQQAKDMVASQNASVRSTPDDISALLTKYR
jgi:hypothetical protein